MRKLFYLVLLLSLQSCSPSIQSGGWIAIVLPAVLGLYFAYKTMLVSFTLRVSIWKVPEIVYAIIFLVSAGGIWLAMHLAR